MNKFNELPGNIQGHFQQAAQDLILDLTTNRLHVILTEAPEQMFEGHMVRTVMEHNIDWWKDLYANYGKKLDKKGFIDALKRITGERPTHYFNGVKYDKMAFEMCKKALTEWYKEKDVINYFETGIPF